MKERKRKRVPVYRAKPKEALVVSMDFSQEEPKTVITAHECGAKARIVVLDPEKVAMVNGVLTLKK